MKLYIHMNLSGLEVKQLRLHDSKLVALHLHSLSGPIIEHCERISFAPKDLRWPEGQRLLEDAGLDQAESAWSEVQDFNWLRRQASPNGRLVPSGSRRPALHLGSAEEVARHFEEQALPCGLPELAICESCWDEGRP